MVLSKKFTPQTDQTEFIPLDKLHFDPQNPRFPSKKVLDTRDETDVLEWMLDDATIIELMNSIGENGYFEVEPLMVIDAGKEADGYFVIEGNRRLAALILLSYPQKAPIKKQAVRDASSQAKVRPKQIPSKIYSSRDSILYYLGYRHITGIKEWDPLAKARYLEQLRGTLTTRDLTKQYQALARTIGSSPSYVGRLLTGLALYETVEEKDFYRLQGVSETTINFSLITTAIQYSNIVRYLGISNNTDASLKNLVDSHLRQLISWMFEKGPENTTRLGESRNLKKLNAVVGSKQALAAFERGESLEDAALRTGVPTEIFRMAIAKARKFLQSAREYIYKMKSPDESDIEILADIIDQATFLHRSLKELFPKNKK